MNRSLFSLSLSLLFTASVVSADVKITSYTKSGGFQGFGAHESTQVRTIQGLKSREESSMKFKGFMMKAANKKMGHEARIVRIDRDKQYNVNLKKKTYTEYPIKLQQNPFTMPKQSQQRGQQAGSKKSDKPTHRVKKTSFDVKKTGKTKTINGFKTTEHQVTMMIQIEDIQNKTTSEINMINHLWVTPITSAIKKAMDEEAKFSMAYLKKLGLSVSPEKSKSFDANSISAMLGVGDKKTQESIKKLAKKMQSIKGYPIVTEAKWIVEEDPKMKAQREAAMKEAQANANKQDANINYDGGAKGIASGLLGGFAKKKMQKRALNKQQERVGKPMMSTYHEVKSIETSKVSSDLFEIKKGFKNVTPKGKS